MEPNTTPSSNLPHPPSVSHGPYQGITSLQSSSPSSTSQDMITNNDNVQESKPVVGGLSQPLHPIGRVAESASILNNLSQIRQAMDSSNLNTANFMGLQPMGATPMAMHMSNVISSGMASTALLPAQNVFSSGAMQPSPGPDKYVKVWEGAVSGQRQGQPVFITKLEGYRHASASETLAADWPMMMQIVRLISQEDMHNKQYVGMADFLVFRALNQHGFLGQLQEKKLCAVIKLPSQTLLLSVSDKASRLIGMLFPGDMVVFKPQPPTQQQQQQRQQSMNSTNLDAAYSMGLQTMGATPMAMHMSNVIHSGMASTALPPSQNVFSSGTRLSAPGPNNYVKVWEGALHGQRQGQPVFITKLEGYRSASASEMLAADWPMMIQIVRLISQHHMHNKQYVGMADFLVFRALDQHGFLGQLQEKKLCAVIQLPSKTLLLCVSDKASRLIGMLLPRDMVVFKPQIPAQQQQLPQLQQQLQQQ
ncbi:mediator of RNA polymerase II transcription subunit 25-like isoform X2 [Papaver somniferum]|uniref:mediator of RNA polymerase II transcription subunit 25-like isoform X2 n=1 Tax=Papaver somniferum TaxID=3469 RepID=UPI000E6FCBB8|nr:mediator of RNA polymerase II transcription subunit 25-like isoform X2 [Papaver somniferum]